MGEERASGFTSEQALQLVSDVAVSVATSRTVPEIVAAVAEGARQLPGHPAVTVGVADDDHGPIRLMALDGFDPTTRERWGTIPRTAPVPLTDVLRTGSAMFIPSLDVFARRYPNLLDEVAVSGHRSWAAVPLQADVGSSGVVGLAWSVEKLFSDEERMFLLVLSKLGGEALRRASRDIDRRELAVLLADASDAERADIARDLHDQSVQRLAAASIRLGSVRADLLGSDDRQLDDVLSSIESEVQQVIRSLRDIIVSLHPPDLVDLTLREAVDDLVEWLFAGRTVVSVHDALGLAMNEPAAKVAYAVIAEALSNVNRHAAASRVTIGLRPAGDNHHYILTVQDDGVGLGTANPPTRRGHLGLQMVRDRVELADGTLTIVGEDGVRLEATLPLPARLRSDQCPLSG